MQQHASLSRRRRSADAKLARVTLWRNPIIYKPPRPLCDANTSSFQFFVKSFDSFKGNFLAKKMCTITIKGTASRLCGDYHHQRRPQITDLKTTIVYGKLGIDDHLGIACERTIKAADLTHTRSKEREND